MNERAKKKYSRMHVDSTHQELPKNSWDRQLGEGDAPFEAFAIYRDMGAGRTARKVALRMGKAPSHVLKYSSVFNWKVRANDYDAHLDQLAQREREDAIKEMARKHVMAAEFMWRKAVQVIQAAKVEDISVKDAIAMFRAALPVERQGRAADQASVPTLSLAQMYQGAMEQDDDDEEAGPGSVPGGL